MIAKHNFFHSVGFLFEAILSLNKLAVSVVLTFCCLTSFFLHAQKNEQDLNYIIRGRIFEAVTGEPVIGANVYLSSLKRGATSNPLGEYFLRLPEGKHTLLISSIGYENLTLNIILSSDTLFLHEMATVAASLDEVVVTGQADHVNSLRMGQNSLDLLTLKKMPPLLGEADIIRGLLLMPGVSTVGEGATGFNVRGGSVDQNLILLDEAPVFNTSHLFGFLTAFNSNAVLNADLYKASIPASFGGRVASVLDIKLKQGNQNRLGGQVGVGLMAANLTLEGPIIPQQTTFLISGRSSYSDWLLRTVPEENISDSKASFYDGIVKLSHKFSSNHVLSFTGYRSHDSFKFAGDTTYRWSTQNFTLKLGSTISPNLFLMTSLVSSDYKYRVIGSELTNEFNWCAGIKFLNAKVEANLAVNENNKSEFGAGVENYNVDLGTLKPLSNSNINAFEMDDDVGTIGYAYFSHQLDVTDRFSIRAGMRGSIFEMVGPKKVSEYDEGQPMSEVSFVGFKQFNKGDLIQNYYGIEPRVSMRFSISPTASLKANYDQTIQYLHLISNTSAVSPIDLWKLSDQYLKPQSGKQFSLGYFTKLNRGNLDASVEGFFKLMENVVDYKDGAELLLNDKLEADLLQGEGRAYGTEWMVEKKRGRFTGWIAYTLSRTEKKIKGKFPQETINKGDYYPANYDKLHNFSFTGSYTKKERVTWGFNFAFASGRPVTYPTSSYGYAGVRVVNFEFRNNERSPAYHRLDFSLEIKSKVKEGRKWKGAWVASIYNVYARKNPYSIFFRSEQKVIAQAFRLAVLGTAVPSISYNISF